MARTPEGPLVRVWRENLGLTQEELGHACPKPLSKVRVHRIERGTHSVMVSTLLNIVRGLGVPGRDDTVKLARFFSGAERQDAEDVLYRAMEDLQAMIRPRARKRTR